MTNPADGEFLAFAIRMSLQAVNGFRISLISTLFCYMRSFFLSELRLTSNASFTFECIGFLFLLFYRNIKCRCLLCLEVWTCSLLAVV